MHARGRNPNPLEGLVSGLSARLAAGRLLDNRRWRLGRIRRGWNRGIGRIQTETQFQFADPRFQESNVLPQNSATGAVSLSHETMLANPMPFSCASFFVNGYETLSG